MSALAQLIYAALLIPGARLAERWGRRKVVVVLSVGLVRINLLLSVAGGRPAPGRGS